MASNRSLVLVVDDTALFRELETLCIRPLADVITASHAAEALEMVRTHEPDLVVLDLSLPDLDGALVCREITGAERSARIPVIAIGSGSSRDHARAIEAGAADVLAKPLSRDVLVRSVRRFTASSTPLGLPRVGLETPVRIAGAGQSRLALARNVSRGGIFVESSWEPPDADLHLSFV
ncbi:MAG: response regulator, partial [Myxococcota bacterium]|nr:response regulator [Myxococcota bacterium]